MHLPAVHVARPIKAAPILAPILAAMLLQIGAGVAPASTCGCGEDVTFANQISVFPAMALVKVETRPNDGFVLVVEAVFKGRFPSSRLTFAGPVPDASIDRNWKLAIVAFDDDPMNPLTSLDLGGGAIAWHVTDAGRVDPEKNWQVDGTPQTLAAWFRYFHLPPPTSTVAPTSPAPAGEPVLAEIAAAAGLAAAFALRRRAQTRNRA